MREVRRQLRQEDTVVVAVSGGIDSVALAHLMKDAANEIGFQMVVCHVDHQLRGEESIQDAEFVQQLAAALSVTCQVERVDVSVFRKEHRVTLQVAARELRYFALQKVADANGTKWVALAHNADDQAETMMLKLLRGTSPHGLASMRRVSYRDNVRLWRPLLNETRDAIERYIQEHQLPFREDASNLSMKYKRNQLRHHLLPILREEYNPNIVRNFGQLADLLQAEDDFIDGEAKKLFQAACTILGEQAVLVRQSSVLNAPIALQRRVVTLILYYLYSNSDSAWDFTAIETVLRMFRHASPSATAKLVHDVHVERRYDVTLISRAPLIRGCAIAEDGSFVQPVPKSSGVQSLVVPGVTEWGAGAWRLKSDLTDKAQDLQNGLNRTLIYIDLDALFGLPLGIRRRAVGDRFRPFGANHHKRLKDLFIDRKVPRAIRDEWPVLVAGDHIVWVVGLQRSADYPVTEHSTRLLRIEWLSSVAAGGITGG